MLNERRKAQLEALFGRVRPFLPWISLVLGVGGAFLMDRSPDKAWMVATSVVLMWALLGAFIVVSSIEVEELEERKRVMAKVFTFSAMVGAQSLIQICLFFALPFYWRSASLLSGHAVFFNLLLISCALTLWDPVWEWVFAHRFFSTGILAFATFAGLNCILPVMGLSNRLSLYGSAILTSLAIPLLLRLYGLRFEDRRQQIAFDVVAALPFPVLIALGGAYVIPPAPISLSDAAIGTTIQNKWIVDETDRLEGVPSRLACATAIAAPRGLKDELFHVWDKDGHEMDRIALNVRGGREEGFRTWSIKKHLGRAPLGVWTCRVETASGQVVGRRRRVEIVEAVDPESTPEAPDAPE